MGADRLFTAEQFEQAWWDYFSHVENNPWIKKEVLKGGDRAGEIIDVPTIEPFTEIGFCAYHNLGEHYLTQLARGLAIREKREVEEGILMDEDSYQMSVILARMRAKCKSQKFAGAAVGAFNAMIISRDLNLVERTDMTSKDEKLPESKDPVTEMKVTIVYPNEVD